MAIPPPFDPRNCKWGFYPYVPYYEFGTWNVGQTNSEIGYGIGVLHCLANQPCLPQTYPGPYTYTSGMASCVLSFKTWAHGLDGVTPVNTTMDVYFWQWMQALT